MFLKRNTDYATHIQQQHLPETAVLSQAVRTSSKSSLRPPGFTSCGVPAPCQLLPLITPCSLAPPTLTLNSSTLSNSRPPQEGLYLLFPLLRTWLSELLLAELALPPMSYWLPGRCLPAPQAYLWSSAPSPPSPEPLSPTTALSPMAVILLLS